jgi:uncharacterized protein (TIGR00375 family)
MELPLIAKQAELKGLQVVGTGDALHPLWIKHLKENLIEESGGIYAIKNSNTKFLITTEVEDKRRVHHLILLPSLSSSESLAEKLKKFSVDMERDGRAHIRLNGKELVDFVKDVQGMIGPSHAFTPWTAIYKEYDSLGECYGDNLKEIEFLELGLSADTYLADKIPELQDITFMSNSDTHSPYPHRLGREFNRIEVKELNFSEIKKAIKHEGGRKFSLNVGLNPKEGKYHLTSCTRCFLRFKVEDAIRLKWRCPECGGIIKKGVLDRINELAKFKEARHPWHRPKYMHILPLAEVISLALNISTITSKKIENEWNFLIRKFGTEINVLVDANIEEIKKFDPKVGKIIEKFRLGRMRYIPGGGGQYGKPTLKNESPPEFWGSGQKRLGEF